MCALFDHLAVIDHDHLIGIADRAQPLRDAEDQPAMKSPVYHPAPRKRG